MPDGIRAGFEVHWREMGGGGAPTLMLHCALAHGGAWAPLVALLPGLRAIAPDMPGHGQSGDWDGRCDIHDQVTAIAETFLEDDCHVIGHSFGATVGLRLALENPGRVRSLVLIEPVLFAAAQAVSPAAFAAHEQQARPFWEAFERGDPEEAARLFTGQWGDGRDWDTLDARLRDNFAERIGFVLESDRSLNQDAAGLLDTGRLEAIGVPVLLIRGDGSDPIVAPIHAALADRLPDVRQVVIEGAGHMLPLTHAPRVAAEIGAFLERV